MTYYSVSMLLQQDVARHLTKMFNVAGLSCIAETQGPALHYGLIELEILL